MKRYLFVNPFLHPPGGGEGVANWMIQSLSERGEVTLLTWDPPNFQDIDRYYGTDLGNRTFTLLSVAPRLRALLRSLKIPHRRLSIHLLERRAKQIRSSYTLCLSAYNELDLGPPAVQYIHRPIPLKSDHDSVANTWSKGSLKTLLWQGYKYLLHSISPHDSQHIRRNFTLANSHWTSVRFRKAFDADPPTVLYPPSLLRPPTDVEHRREAFISVGRVHPVKNWPLVIEILSRVRSRGFDVELTLVGGSDDADYLRYVTEKVEQNAGWVSLLIDQTRQQLDRLLFQHRYAIHGMVEEHFGMAVAEEVSAGCLTFVHDSGGQVEIVSHPEARYRDSDDAVEKIVRALSDEQRRDELLASQSTSKERLSRESFLRRFDAIISDLEQI